MRLGAVFVYRRLPIGFGAARMRGDPLAPLKDLDRSGGQTDFDLPAHQLTGIDGLLYF